MPGKVIFRMRHLTVILMIAFLVLGLSFLALSLNASLTHAAPSNQGEVLRLTLPVTNTDTTTTIYEVTNLSTQTISTRHEFYAGGYPGGRFVAVFTDTYLLLESKLYALSRIPEFPQNFVGEVVVFSDQPITGSASIRTIAPPIVIQPPTSPTGTLLLPALPSLDPERVEINWTLITYIIVGLFALSGFFKGWWKEAITSFFIGILIFFLAVPRVAEWFIDLINRVITFVVDLLPDLGLVRLNPIQLNPSSGQTWLIILLLFIGLAILISRASLSSIPHLSGNYVTYVVTPIGGILGAILGGLNGFLIITLVRHYLEGSNLPGNGGLPTEIVTTAGGIVAASPGLNIRITNLPNFTLFNAFLPWLIIVFGILIFFLMWQSWRKKLQWPGYIQYPYEIKKEKDKTTISTKSESVSIFFWSSE